MYTLEYSTCTPQKRVTDSLELELEVVCKPSDMGPGDGTIPEQYMLSVTKL